MPRTILDIRTEIRVDPCRQFRRILKSKQMDDENNKLFKNKDIAAWTETSEAAASLKMNGSRQFSLQDMRMIMEHVPFDHDEKARVFG